MSWHWRNCEKTNLSCNLYKAEAIVTGSGLHWCSQTILLKNGCVIYKERWGSVVETHIMEKVFNACLTLPRTKSWLPMKNLKGSTQSCMCNFNKSVYNYVVILLDLWRRQTKWKKSMFLAFYCVFINGWLLVRYLTINISLG